MAQRNEFNPYGASEDRPSSRRSGYGYEQDMPQRNDFGGHRGRNQFEEDRQFRGMNDEESQRFEQPRYSMDFNRNTQRQDGSQNFGQSWQAQDPQRRQSDRRPFDAQDQQFSGRSQQSARFRSDSAPFRSASDDMRSADRYRTRGGDDDGPGLYGGPEDFGHAGLEERFDYGSQRHPYPSAIETSSRSRSMSSDGAGMAWAYEQGSQWGAPRNGSRDAGIGEHRGKGPKNYSRSDDRIREDVCEYLMQDSDIDASEIDVKVASGEVTMSGTVSSKDQKRRAEDIIERISGVKDVQNDLRIETSAESRTSSSASIDGSSSNGSSNSKSNNTARNSSARVS